jgi:flagellar hook assembly protein FlgD
MCTYNYWLYREGNKSYDIFQIIGLEKTADLKRNTGEAISIKWDADNKKLSRGKARIEILNINGERVRSMNADASAGLAEWDLRDNSGSLCPTGIYIAKVKGPGRGRAMTDKKIKIVIGRHAN